MKSYAKLLLRLAVFAFALGLAVFIAAECMVIAASRGDARPDADYIIVLGAKVNADGPSSALLDRLGAALSYMEENEGTIAVVSGGQGEDEPESEGKCMRDWLVAQGIDEERIIIEDRATNTRENLRFSCELIGEGWREKRIAVVSSEYHLCRADYIGKKLLGYDFETIPAATSLVNYRIYYFVREALGIVYTRLFYF